MRFCEIARTSRIGRAAAFAVVAFFAVTRPASAASIYLDFGAFSLAPSDLFGAAADAGVWNRVSLLGVTPDLLDVDGNATGARVSVMAGSMDGTGGPGSTDASLLMHDNFYSANGTAWSVSLSGLEDGIYDLYLYDPTNRAVSTGSGTANGVGFASINGAFSGSLSENVDYVLLSGISVTGGLLTAGATEPGGSSGLAGLQLVARETTRTAVPEPEILTLLACGLLAVASLKHRSPTSRA